MIYLKTCKKCKCVFDIGINFDFCPGCRLKELEKTKEVKHGETED